MTRLIWLQRRPRLHTRRARRFLVCLMSALFVLAFQTPVAAAFLLMLYIAMPWYGLPPMSDRSPVDERQWRVRAEAFTIAYRILALAAGITLLVHSASPIPSDKLVFGWLALIVCLPPAVLAWREPDDPEDEA